MSPCFTCNTRDRRCRQPATVSLAKVATTPRPPTTILAIDIGGTKLTVLLSGQNEPRKTPSGKTMTPGKMVEAVRELTADWEYDAISIGYPSQVGPNGPRSEPLNLG